MVTREVWSNLCSKLQADVLAVVPRLVQKMACSIETLHGPGRDESSGGSIRIRDDYCRAQVPSEGLQTAYHGWIYLLPFFVLGLLLGLNSKLPWLRPRIQSETCCSSSFNRPVACRLVLLLLAHVSRGPERQGQLPDSLCRNALRGSPSAAVTHLYRDSSRFGK